MIHYALRPILAAALVAFAGCADPEVAPQPEPAEPQIQVEPSEGQRGAEVLVSAMGFPPDSPVEIGFGPPASEYEVIAVSTSDERGSIRERVQVPEWADAGRTYVFVAAEAQGGPGRVKATSEPFLVR